LGKEKGEFMSFSKEHLNHEDYRTLNDMYARELAQKGWVRTWGENSDGEYGSGYRPANSDDGAPVQNLYEAWAAATGTPTDLERGVTYEPKPPVYRQPV
jgi:hypothetical protein